MSLRCDRAVAVTIAATAALSVAGCKTTAEKSAALERANRSKPSSARGLNVTRANRDVKILETAVLADEFGQAAVVELENRSRRSLVDVPVELAIEDRAGKEIFRNDTPGLDPALTRVPLLPPRTRAFWVYDQLTLPGKGGRVKAQIGEADAGAAKQPRFKVTQTRIERDPDGIVIAGRISHDGAVTQPKLVIYGLAKRAGRIVAAGTAQLEKLKPGRRQKFQMFFVGDPSRAEVEFFVPPTAPSS